MEEAGGGVEVGWGGGGFLAWSFLLPNATKGRRLFAAPQVRVKG